MPPPTLFVGRDREQAVLRALLAETRAGRGGLLLLAGEAGVGKTALVDWLAGAARQQDMPVLWGGCYDLAVTSPYGPWIEALAGLAAAHPLQQRFAGTPDGNQTLLFSQVREHLARAAAQQPLVLVLEDMHWSDPAGLELLRAVARGGGVGGVLLVATYRSTELERTSALAALLPLLARESRATRIDLAGLRLEDVLALVQGRYELAHEDAAALAGYLRERCAGNPFFLNEVLRTLEHEGLLRQVGGGWQIGDLSSAPVPPLVRQVIEQRLAGLDMETRELLEAAAVVGQEVPLRLLQALCAGNPRYDQVLQQALESHALFMSRAGAGPAFAHALVRETLYDGQPLGTRRRTHRRIAELLSDEPAPPAQRIASHFAAAGDPRAIDWLVQAGERALALYAARDAVAALSQAQELAVRHQRELPVAVFRSRAAAHALLGEFDLTRRDRETVLERTRALGDPVGEWQALVDLGLHWAERDYERTGRYYNAALRLARELDDQVLIAHSLNRIANQISNLDEPEVALPLHREALAIFETHADHAGIAETLDFLGMTSLITCNLVEALEYYERALSLFRIAGDRQRVASCLIAMQLIGGEQDTTIVAPVYREPDYWSRCGAEAVAIVRDIEWVAGEAFALAMRSFTDASRGLLWSARADAESAIERAEQAGHRQWATAGSFALGVTWMGMLQLDRAAEHMQQALTDARQIGSSFWFRTIAASLTLLRIEQGDLVQAEAQLHAIAPDDVPGASQGKRQGYYAKGELALARGRPAEALAIADDLLRTRPHPEGDHGIPVVSKLRGDALLRMGCLDDAADAYDAAREGARLFGFRPLLWRVDAAIAALLLAEGRVSEANAALRSARATIAEIAETIMDDVARAAFTDHALRRLPALPTEAGLSPRELDVLRLLVEGRSDREIAEALSISPRTVMRHVSGIFNKLGVSSRTAAATLALRNKLV